MYVIGAFFAILGLSNCIRGIWRRIVVVDDPNRYILVILSGSSADIFLKSALELMEADPFVYSGVIAVYDELEPDQMYACRYLEAENARVRMYNVNEFSEILRRNVIES